MSRVYSFLHEYRPHIVIGDEIAKVANPDSKTTAAMCSISKHSLKRFGLTGTPFLNDYDNFQSLSHFLRVKPWDDLSEFANVGHTSLPLRPVYELMLVVFFETSIQGSED